MARPLARLLAPLLVLLLALPLPAAAGPDVARMQADVAWLVEELGPRPADGPEERAAAVGIATRLRDAGWKPRAMGCPACVLACQDADDDAPGDVTAGQPTRLFLAHPDSVPGSPGAVDNAAGVAALLEVARTLGPTSAGPARLCLGFPAAEERGLLGSEAMADAWRAEDGDAWPELVVALDLTGHGRLSVTGLGPAWGGAQLSWLQDTADLDSPYPYRVVSRALPHMERSDHRPWADRGVLALHLLGRDPNGLFPRYHQPTDRQAEDSALADLATALLALARAPSPPPDGPDAAATAGRQVLPAPAVWALLVLGLLSGAWDLLRPRQGMPVLGALRGLLGLSWRAALGLLPAAAVTWLLARNGILAPSEAEQTAQAVMGLAPTGWWAAAPVVLPVGVACVVAMRRALGGAGSAPLAAALSTLLALQVDPLLALPFAIAALAARLHPLLALLPAAYLLTPWHLRELAFHALVPPGAWAVLWLLAWPVFGAYSRSSSPPPDAP
ncbi:MAG: M28 family peptidase [Alphaproteobacteria bacterium]|nr:M28 family peptidase [Alphaproteobacteria bacterium]